MLSNRISKMLLSGAVVGVMAGATSAALNIDVRATGVTGGGTVATPKSVIDVVSGSVVTFDIFAVVTGSNGVTTDDKIISVAGSFKSTGDLLGTLAADYLRTNFGIGQIGFDASGASVGLQQDLDGDGDLDVGSNDDANAANFWAARYRFAPEGADAPAPTGVKIGVGTFTVTAGGAATLLNFDGRGANTAANYFQDGQSISEPSLDGLVPITVTGGGGGPTPEPAALSLLGLAGLGLVRRRRA